MFQPKSLFFSYFNVSKNQTSIARVRPGRVRLSTVPRLSLMIRNLLNYIHMLDMFRLAAQKRINKNSFTPLGSNSFLPLFTVSKYALELFLLPRWDNFCRVILFCYSPNIQHSRTCPFVDASAI